MTYIAVRNEIVSNEMVYIAFGIHEDGSREVLAYTITPTESAYKWQELLEVLIDCGVEDMLLFISEGLKGIVDDSTTVFPKDEYQTCFVSGACNISRKVRKEISME